MVQSSSVGFKIDSREALKSWLVGKSRHVPQAISTRAVLRIMPLLKNEKPSNFKSDLLISILRVIFTYSASTFLSIDFNFDMNRVGANNVAHLADIVNSPDVADVAYAAADVGYAAPIDAIDAAIAAHTYTDEMNEISIWRSIEADCRQFEAGATAIQVMRTSLWHGPAPEKIVGAWRDLTKDKYLVKAGFNSWFQWYEKLTGINGGEVADHFGSKLSIKIAMQPDDWWKRGPEAVNADIARWLAEKEGEAPEEEPELAVEIAEIGVNPPQQRPAAYRFAWRGGKLAPLPPDAAQDAADAAVMLDELRRKTTEFAERLTGRNYEPRIARSVELLLAALPEDLGKVNPGLLRSRGRSIENDAVFFAASDELPDDVKSHLSDLAGSLRDLLFFFPIIRQMEVAARALDLIGADVDQVLRDLAATRDGAAEAVDVVAVETVQAFDAMAQAPEDPATFARSDAGLLWLADRLLVAGNYLIGLFRGAATVVYDKLAQAGTKASDAWCEVRPKLVDGAIAGLEFIKEPAGYSAFIAALTSVSGWCLLGLPTYPLLKPMIERLISHLEKLREKPPDDG